jgi:hypothetical protein
MPAIRASSRNGAAAVIIARRAAAKRTLLVHMAATARGVGIMTPIGIIPTPARTPAGIGIMIPPRIIPARAAPPIPIIVIVIAEAHVPARTRVAIVPRIPRIPTIPIVAAIIEIIVDVNVRDVIIVAIVTIFILIFALLFRGRLAIFRLICAAVGFGELRVATRERERHEHGSEGKQTGFAFHCAILLSAMAARVICWV